MALTKINTNLIANNTIALTNIADNAIDATKIANNQILARHIAAGSISDQLAAAQPTITSLGTLTTLTVDDITINSSTISDGGDLTLDVAASITLDSDSGVIDFDDGGTNIGRFENASSDFKMESRVQDKDIVFVGNDGGTGVEALRIDMSEGGKVGIGTATPASYNSAGQQLVVVDSGNTGISIIGGTSSTSSVMFGDGTGGTAAYRGAIKYDHSSDDMIFWGAAAEKMRIDSSGRVKVAKSAMITEGALTNASTVDWDADAYANATLALNANSYSGNVTIDEPDNPTAGQIISIEIAQDGTPRTVAWHTSFEFAASTGPTMTATANKTDIFSFRYNGSVWQEIGRVQNMAQT